MINISTVIPAYNAKKWIGRAIESVLNQTVRPAEILVIDDGSADGTAQAAQNYGAAVRYFHQQNSGPAVARNRGIASAELEWIAFLDADDEWLPNWVDTQMKILTTYPGIMWSFCNYEHDCAGFWQKIPPFGNGNHIRTASYYDAVLRGMLVGTPGFLIHRSVFEKVGMFNPDIRSGQDLDLWERIAMRYPYIGYGPDICWRRHWQENMDSLSHSERPRDQQVRAICRNALLAQSLGKDVVEAYYPYGRKRALSYILRFAARKIHAKKEAIDEAKAVFPLRLSERTAEKVLSVLPTPIAGKMVGWLVD
jgi:glycosyltransferase involved in cell wall biosynthesis